MFGPSLAGSRHTALRRFSASYREQIRSCWSGLLVKPRVPADQRSGLQSALLGAASSTVTSTATTTSTAARMATWTGAEQAFERRSRGQVHAEGAPRLHNPADFCLHPLVCSPLMSAGEGQTQETFMLTDECILVDGSDRILGTASKHKCHRFEGDQPSGILHRAFSVFLFDEQVGKVRGDNKNGHLVGHQRLFILPAMHEYSWDVGTCSMHMLSATFVRRLPTPNVPQFAPLTTATGPAAAAAARSLKDHLPICMDQYLLLAPPVGPDPGRGGRARGTGRWQRARHQERSGSQAGA